MIQCLHLVRTGRKIRFKDRLSGASHVGKNALAEMPPEKLIGYMVGIGAVTTDRVEDLSIDVPGVWLECDDFVVILVCLYLLECLESYSGGWVFQDRYVLAFGLIEKRN